MRIIKYFLICLLSVGLSSHAQQKKSTNTLLWEISGKGLSKPSYLFGTYHFAGKDFIDTMKVLNAKLDQADAVVGELVMDKASATQLLPYMLMKNNFLDKLLTTDEYELVAAYLKKVAGYDLKLFNSMKPATVQLTLLQFTAPKTFTKENPALDQYFQDYGKAKDKKIIGLETAEDQAKVLFGSSLERQKDLLIKGVKEAEKNKAEAQKLYDYYISQNMEKLAPLFTDATDFSQEEMDQLLKNRNEKWMAQLPNLMQSQSLFIAVGAGHLLGKDGLIKGLQAAGYTVKPLATQ